MQNNGNTALSLISVIDLKELWIENWKENTYRKILPWYVGFSSCGKYNKQVHVEERSQGSQLQSVWRNVEKYDTHRSGNQIFRNCSSQRRVAKPFEMTAAKLKVHRNLCNEWFDNDFSEIAAKLYRKIVRPHCHDRVQNRQNVLD